MVRKKRVKREERQLKWILIMMAILLFFVLLIYFIMQYEREFEYAGLKFNKIMFDKLILYYTKIPVADPYGNIVAYYNLYLRNDPRKLKNIAINSRILLRKNVVVTLDPSVLECDDNIIAVANLGEFLKAIGINAEFATTNKTLANESEIKYATCDTISGKSIITIKKAEKTEILRVVK